MTNALVLITVLMGIDMFFVKLKGKYKKLDRLLEGTPLILVDHGKPLRGRMKEAKSIRKTFWRRHASATALSRCTK